MIVTHSKSRENNNIVETLCGKLFGLDDNFSIGTWGLVNCSTCLERGLATKALGAAIPELWVQLYISQLLSIAEQLPEGDMRSIQLLRAEFVMDMIKAYRERLR